MPGTLAEAQGHAQAASEILDRVLKGTLTDVREAVDLAAQLGDEASPAGVLAHRAAAIALRHDGDMQGSLRHARAAVVAAAPNGLVHEAEAMYTLSLCLAAAGAGDEAIQAAEHSVNLAEGTTLLQARTLVHRALVRHRLGANGWLDDYDVALPVLAQHNDTFWESLARLNRGNALVYLGRVADGRADLERVIAIADAPSSPNPTGLAYARHNLGFAATREGDLATALNAFEDARSELHQLGVDESLLIADRAEALLAAGLVAEAVTLGRRHVPRLASSHPLQYPELTLLLARAFFTMGDLSTAAATAAESVDTFGEQGRHGWALVARGLYALASLPLGRIGPADAARIADDAQAGGWVDVGAEVRAAAGVAAVEEDDPYLAQELIAPLAHHLNTLSLAPQLGIARARMAIAQHARDDAAVLEHGSQALQRLEDRRALLGASELRAHVTRLADDILTRATLAALDLGDLDRAVEWVDRARSQALDQPPVVPPDDEQLAQDLGRLRVLNDRLTRHRAESEPVTDLLDERNDLERRIRDRARTASGSRPDVATTTTRAPDTIEVAYLDLGDHLAALVASDAGPRRVDLDVDQDTIVHELDALGFAMQRVGASRTPGRRRDLAARSLNHSLTTLDDALVSPLGVPADGEVVISPTSVLFDVPWSGMPSLMDRAVDVAPALRLARRPPRDDVGTGTLLLEGPRLSHARAELDALAEVVADPRTVLGEEGTVAAAKEALPEVAIAHLACHGVFRADNPQFSSLELADGPMFVYDLESLPRVPELIVLSACQTGRSAVHVGDELLGVTASLLALGARTVVAALADVPDDLSALLMVAFHQHVRAGAGPAEALAHARRTLLATRDEPAARLTAAAFVCLGAP